VTIGSKSNFFKELAAKANENEDRVLHPRAIRSKEHTRLQLIESDHRPPFRRDVDRIVHSKAYSRYIDKTQVVYLVDNDHITHRSLHVQLVSNFARGVAEVLGLNLDLVEAIALGHDVGHPPFGHEGEKYLSSLSKEYGNGLFAHPHQSCRLFSDIEPLNLGLHVYDGFLCHDGGMKQHILEPNWDKTWNDHLKERQTKLDDPNENIMPGSLEGCLVKISDTMSYVGRDIEDAISIGILNRSDVPDTLLGASNREILTNLAKDLIENSFELNYIALSKEAFEALKTLRSFNFQKIYIHPKLKTESDKIKRAYRILFEFLFDDYESKKERSFLWCSFLHNKSESYLSESTSVQKVVDYIAGMTDKYFVKTLNQVILPSRIAI